MKSLREAEIVEINDRPLILNKQEYPLRLYQYQGQVGASVSSAVSMAVKLELQKYMKKTSGAAIDKRSEETASFGIGGHKLIEDEAAGKEVTPPEELKDWYQEWKKAQTEYKIEEECSEVRVFSKVFAFGGRIDRIGNFNGKKSIIDLKTGRYSHIDLWKTEAYRQAYVELTGDVDIGAVVLYVPRPDLAARGLKVKHYTISRHIQCFSAFLSCYQALRMNYFKELQEVGMSQKDVFANHLFDLYEREFGASKIKEVA